jgi:Fur family transcriptional regulator, ferric uptake regulator
MPMSIYDLNSLKGTLHSRGFRLTNQRRVILNIFQELPKGDHLSAEALHHSLRQRGEKISLSTVYRTLHLMAIIGLLRELEFGEAHKCYELNLPGSHHHLVCTQCNYTLEFIDEEVVKVGEQQAKTKGYQVLDYQLVLHVLCPEALEREARGVLSQGWKCDRIREPLKE